MADTRQIVMWALERPCDFRSSDEWFFPNRTAEQLRDLRRVASAAADMRIVNGICVTGWTPGRDNQGEIHELPLSGFRMEDQLAPFGGQSVVLNTCRACEANVKSELGFDIAGCFGNLNIWPDSAELDRELWRIIEERRMGERLRSAFPKTDPLWYGFWINSPLRRNQAEFLHELLHVACDHDDPRDQDVRHFLKALEGAMRCELPLHVALLPLGHTDDGWYTIFPHCPRCKANAPVGRWKDDYPNEPHTCRVCGHSFIPNEHHSNVRDETDWEADDLQKLFDEPGYEQFVRAFLVHRGCSPERAEEVIANEK